MRALCLMINHGDGGDLGQVLRWILPEFRCLIDTEFLCVDQDAVHQLGGSVFTGSQNPQG